MLSYPKWLLLFAVLPLAALWLWKFNLLKKYKNVFVFTVIGSVIFSFPWDYIAIRERVWYFTKPHIFGIWIVGLPLEEWVFIILETLLFTAITLIVFDYYNRR